MYNYQFTDSRIEEYFFKNVIDPKRMSTEECIRKKLPYVDDKGFLRNTSAFMEVNRYYKENGHYPSYPPGSKEWRDFWINQEKRNRCTNGIWLGQIRLTGYHYFFLNYHFMDIGVEREDGSKDEVYSLGSFWKIHFEFFHLVEYCEKNGLDISLIKPRGCGLTECAAGMNERDYFVPKVNPKTGKPDSLPSNQIIAEDTAYLKGKGKIFDLIVSSIDKINSFGNSHGMYKISGVTRKESSVMHLVPGYITEGGKGEPVQTGGSIEAKAMKKADKGVGGRKSKFMLEECQKADTEVIMYDGSIKMLKDLKIGDLLMGVDSTPREVLKINKGKAKLLSVYENRKNHKDPLMYVTEDHILPCIYASQNRKMDVLVRASDFLTVNANGYYSKRANSINYPKKEVLLNPYFLGLWLGDGSSLDQKIVINEKDHEIVDFLQEYVNTCGKLKLHKYKQPKNYTEGNQCYHFSINLKQFEVRGNKVLNGLKDYNLINNKHIPQDFIINDEETRFQVLAGLIDTDGYLHSNHNKEGKISSQSFVIEQKRKNIIEAAAHIARSLGFCAKEYEYTRVNNITYYSVHITGNVTRIPTKIKRKQAVVDVDKSKFAFKVLDEGLYDEYVGIILDKDHLYLQKDFTIVHNCGVFQELGGILKKLRPNTIRRSNHGDVKTGFIMMWGTSNTDTRGTESFRAILKNPDLYGCVKFRNVHSAVKDSTDKILNLPRFAFEYMLHHTSDEKGVGHFIPYYDSYYMDDDGNPLRDKSYLAIMETRKRAMELAKEDVDKENLMREIADHPITMEEALLVSKGRYFTNPMVSRQLVNLETGVVESTMMRGDLTFEKDKNGVIIGVIWYDNPNGLIQILEHPEWAKKDTKGRWIVKIDEDKPWRLNIAGIDSVDQGIDDSAGTGSNLGCVIKKRRPVEDALSATYPETYIALYNHRSHNVKHDYENILKLLLYFNAQALLEYTKVRIRDYIVDEMGFGKFLAYEPDLSHTISNFKRKKLKKGIRATKDVILFYLGLITEYIDDSCEKILIKDLLDQIANYTYEEKGSYDLIAAMGMCEILATEYRDRLPTKVDSTPQFRSPRWYKDPYSGKKVFGVPPEKEQYKEVVKSFNPVSGKITI